MKSEKSKKFLSRVGFYGLLLFFALLRAVASYVFIVPNAFAPGGVGGIASIVYNVVNLYDHKLAEGVFNPAVTIFVLNLPLVIASFSRSTNNLQSIRPSSFWAIRALWHCFPHLNCPYFKARAWKAV